MVKSLASDELKHLYDPSADNNSNVVFYDVGKSSFALEYIKDSPEVFGVHSDGKKYFDVNAYYNAINRKAKKPNIVCKQDTFLNVACVETDET